MVIFIYFFFFWQKKLHYALTIGYIDCRLRWFLCVVDSNGHAREIWLIWPFMELYICCASFLILLFVRLFRLRSGTSALQKYYMPESKLMFKLLDSTFTNCSIVKILKICVRCVFSNIFVCELWNTHGIFLIDLDPSLNKFMKSIRISIFENKL